MIEEIIDLLKLLGILAFFGFIVSIIFACVCSPIEDSIHSKACIKSGELIEVVSYYDKDIKMCVDKLPNGKNRLRDLGRNSHHTQAYTAYTPIIMPISR